jgi:hypothetical protein
VRGVVSRQVGIGLDRAEIVDGDDLDIVFLMALVMSAEYVAADAAVAIDGDANGHVVFPAGGCEKSVGV